MDTAIVIEIIIGSVTIAVSLIGSAFIAGNRWGRIESDIRSISERIARIEVLFTLRLRRNNDDTDSGRMGRDP